VYLSVSRALVLAGFLVSSGVGAAADEGSKNKPAPRTDLYGDALPDGAVARFGSIRLRHAGLSDFVFLPGGKTLLSAGSDRSLRFWDMADGRQVRAVPLQGTMGPGRTVTLSPDGQTLAAIDKEKVVFWDVDSGKEIKTLPSPHPNVGYLYFSPDGKTLAVGRGDWRVTFYEWETGKTREIPLPMMPRPAVQTSMDSTFHGSFSPDGKWFVAGAGWNEPLGVFEMATGVEIHRLRCYASTSMVSPDSKHLAVASLQNDNGGRETVVRLFDLATGKEEAKYALGHENWFYTLAFSPDGKTLACGFSDRSCLLDCATGRILQRLSGRPVGVAFTPDGKTLVASGAHAFRFWDMPAGQERPIRPGQFGYSPVLAVSPDGQQLASADDMEQTVSLWDTRSGRLLRQLPLKGAERYVRNLGFSGDGQTLVASHSKGFLQFWDVADGKELRTVQLDDPAHPNKNQVDFSQLQVSPDGKRVATLERMFGRGESTRLGLWEIATGKLVRQQAIAEAVRECAWLPGGAAVALPLNDGLTLMDVATGQARLHILGTASGGPLAASLDGRLLAARRTSEPGAKSDAIAVGVWEVATGKEVAAVTTGRFDHLALAADNRCLVTSDEGFLHVWDLTTGKERRRWPLPVAGIDSWGKTFVFRMLLSPDGRRAFTALADGTALVWDLTPALHAAEPPPKGHGEKEIAAWWADLADADASRAYAAVWQLADVPEPGAVAFFREHLKPAPGPDREQVRQHIKDLDSDTFAVREKAFEQLDNLGSAAVPALRQALEQNPSAEVRRRVETLLSRSPGLVRSPEVLRRLRAIQVVERLASKDARRLLAELAKGEAHAAETQEATMALERLAHHDAKP
jgi:WD40 repeat protein